jgi:hypothetical protein
MHKNIHVHLYKITIEYTRTLLYNTVRNKENNKRRKEVKNMKRTKNMIYKASDEARELFLYATNSGVLYDRQIKPSIENLRKKARKGTFDKDKAADLFYYVATSASAMYDKDFGFSFSVQQRFTAAVDMVDFYIDEIEEI